jgi:predicted metal-dependent hydrolase
MFRKTLRRLKRRTLPISTSERHAYEVHKEVARKIIVDRLNYWANVCELPIKRVAIKCQRRSWGSCSSLGNLNFNYKVAFLPPCLRDYIIIHELCHLRHLHHRQTFWDEVGKYCANYKKLNAEIHALERNSKMKREAIVAYTNQHVCAYCTKLCPVDSILHLTT